MMRRKLLFRIILGIVGAFAVAQVLSYLFVARATMAATAVRFLPQYTHFAGGTRFDFVCVSGDTWSAISTRQREALDLALSQHFRIVYHGELEIPPEKRQPRGLIGGCIIGWKLRRDALFWFTAEYSDWEGVLAGSGRRATFVLLLGRWMHVWTSHEIMS